MSKALQLKSPALARAMENMDETGLRATALRAARMALDGMKVENASITDALAQVEKGVFGDVETITKLRKLADDIERPYEAALDIAKPVENDERLMGLFRQARAVIALSLAMDTDITKQAGNAVYEALYAGLTDVDIQSLLTASK